MNTGRRVVVTGLGAVTPIGNNVKDMWNSMVQGVCGIASITSFDTTEFKAKLAAEVKDFDPLAYMPKLEAYFHYRNLDVSSLKIVANMWRPDIMEGFTKKEAHLALDDIRESIAELRYYRKYLIKNN